MPEQSTRGDDTAPLAAATETMRETAGQVREQAGRVVDQIREHAEGFANEKKAAAADQIKGLASALRKTADDLGEHEFGFAAYVGQAASGLEEFSDSIRDRDIGTLLSEVEGMAKRYPAMFLGATVVAGFMFARFLKSGAQGASGSASRAAQSGAAQRPQRRAEGAGGAAT